MSFSVNSRFLNGFLNADYFSNYSHFLENGVLKLGCISEWSLGGFMTRVLY